MHKCDRTSTILNVLNNSISDLNNGIRRRASATLSKSVHILCKCLILAHDMIPGYVQSVLKLWLWLLK